MASTVGLMSMHIIGYENEEAATFYRAILDDIEAHNYDVFSRRAYISKWGKIRRLPGIWRRAKRR